MLRGVHTAGLSRLWEQLSALHVMLNQMMDWARAASPTRARPVPAPAPPLPAPAVALPQLTVPKGWRRKKTGQPKQCDYPFPCLGTACGGRVFPAKTKQQAFMAAKWRGPKDQRWQRLPPSAFRAAGGRRDARPGAIRRAATGQKQMGYPADGAPLLRGRGCGHRDLALHA